MIKRRYVNPYLFYADQSPKPVVPTLRLVARSGLELEVIILTKTSVHGASREADTSLAGEEAGRANRGMITKSGQDVSGVQRLGHARNQYETP